MTGNTEFSIVVGIDGSPSSREAYRWARWHAGLTGGHITAVTSWEIPMAYGWSGPGLDEFESAADEALTDILQDDGDSNTRTVDKRVVQGHPANVVLTAVDDVAADMLVLGSRGHGGFVGAVLGSVSQYCVAHAPCPVLIVRDQRS